jgi:hypothetical protein
VQTGSLPTVRGVVAAADLSRSQLTTWFPALQQRLLGVYGIRFTTKFTLVVASSPFQQALLCMNFQYGAWQTNTTTYPRVFNPALTTNLPHVLLDLAESTMAELTIPFLYAYDFMPIVTAGTNTGSLTNETVGVIGVNTLMPYRTIAGVNAPTFKLMVSLHDLELVGSYPSVYNSVTTQSGLSKTKAVGSRGSAILEEEREVRGSDKVLSLSSKIRTISSYIPFLSSIGSITSNALDTGANVAKVFGYAKPQLLEPPQRVFRTNYIGEGNVDMDSSGFVLAPFQNNRVAVDSLAGGTDVDEMALQYVIGRYGQVFVGTMATTDSTTTPLYTTSVCPTNFWFRTNTGRPGGNLPLPNGATLTTNALALSPLAYTAQFFRYWRGTMKFRFTFSKTKFHGGRVLVAYVPEFDDVLQNSTLSALVPIPENSSGAPQPFQYSMVCDLRDESVFEFEVPYVAPTPFTNILSGTGGVSMVVLDPLIASGETATTIDYMVEVKAEDDFEFACPAPPMFSVATPGANQTNTVFYQSGLGGVDKIGDAAQYTIGETILSFKQLMMIPSYFTAQCSSSATPTVGYLWPFWCFGRFVMAAPLPNTTAASMAFTRSGCIAAMYAFATGGTDYHVYFPGGNPTGFNMSIAAVPVNNGFAAVSNGDPRTRAVTGAQRVITSDNSLHVRVPSYQRVARIPITDGNGKVTFTFPDTTPLNSIATSNTACLSVNNSTATAVNVVIGRAAADDARCIGYIGPPPVALLQSTQTSYPDTFGSLNLGPT